MLPHDEARRCGGIEAAVLRVIKRDFPELVCAPNKNPGSFPDLKASLFCARPGEHAALTAAQLRETFEKADTNLDAVASIVQEADGSVKYEALRGNSRPTVHQFHEAHNDLSRFSASARCSRWRVSSLQYPRRVLRLMHLTLRVSGTLRARCGAQ